MHGKRHGRSHAKRQDLVQPALSGIFGEDPLPTPSITLGVITDIFPLAPSSSTTTSTISSSTSSSSSSSESTTSATSTTPTAFPSIYETTSGGSVHTVTTLVEVPSHTESVAPAHKSFLQNEALSGVVFAFAGLAGLIIIISITTFVLRRKRNDRLLREAISFDPVAMNNGNHHGADIAQGSTEKRSISTDNSHELTTLPRNQERGPEQGQEYGYGANYTPRTFGHPHPQLP